MRNHAAGISIILLFTMVILADSGAANLKYGISGGVNRTTVHYEDDYFYLLPHHRSLFNVMVFAESPVRHGFFVQTGIRFLKTGYHVDLDIRTLVQFAPTPLHFKITTSYVAVPLKLKRYLRGTSGMYFTGGIEPEFLVDARSEFIDIDGSTSEENKTGLFRRLNVAGVAGVGFEHGFRRHSVFLECDYYYGLRKLSDESNDFYRGRSREICFNFGLRF